MRRRRFGVLMSAVTIVLVACRAAEPPQTPALAAPTSTDDIVGIWRNIHQGVLELRSDGTFVLISPITEPADGRYELTADRLQLGGTETCRGVPGTYSVRVAREARMHLGQPDDGCALRRKVLSTDPWVYTPR